MRVQEYNWWRESEELLAGGAPQSRPHHTCGIPVQGTAEEPSIPTEPAEACGRHGGGGAALRHCHGCATPKGTQCLLGGRLQEVQQLQVPGSGQAGGDSPCYR